VGEVKNEPQAFYRILFVAGGSVGFGCSAMAGVKSFGTGDQRRRTTGTTEQKMSLLRRRVGGSIDWFSNRMERLSESFIDVL